MEPIQLNVLKHITSIEGKKQTNPKTCTQTPREKEECMCLLPVPLDTE